MKKRIKKKIFKKKFDRPYRKYQANIEILKEMERVVFLGAIPQAMNNSRASSK